MHTGVDFFAAIAVSFEAVAGFEELDLCGIFCFLGGSRGLHAGFAGWLLGSLLRLRERKNDGGKETRYCDGAQEHREAEMKSQDGLAGSVGRV